MEFGEGVLQGVHAFVEDFIGPMASTLEHVGGVFMRACTLRTLGVHLVAPFEERCADSTVFTGVFGDPYPTTLGKAMKELLGA